MKFIKTLKVIGQFNFIILLIQPAQYIHAARVLSEYGYDNLIELKNTTTRVVLEPNMGGRVLSYKLHDIEVLYQDPKQAGLHPGRNGNVGRIAGGRFDIGPAFALPQHKTLWQGKWKGEITGEFSARLTSQIDPDCGIQLIREFTLDPDNSRLRCRQTIINYNSRPVWAFFWSRTFAKGGGIALAPVPEMGHFPRGYALARPPRGGFDFLPEPEANIRIRDNILEFIGPSSIPKSIFNLSEGWMAYLTTEDILFLKTFPFNPDWRYGDPTQHHASLWFEGTTIIEIEPNGPLEVIPPGGRASFHEDWHLASFPFPENRVVDLDYLRKIITGLITSN
jgi:hypothetical protein